MAKKIDELGKVTPSTGDTYVIYDASTGDAATVDVILPMGAATASVAGTAGFVPASGVGQQNRVLTAGATWVDQNITSPISGIIMEVGNIECSNGSWNTKSLTLGGIEFYWSQAASSGGNLLMKRAAGITKSSGGATAYIKRYTDSAIAGGANSANPAIWATDETVISSGVSITGGYQYIHYEMVSRGQSTPSIWEIKAYSTGTSSLVLAGTYIGPKIT